nr:hypothetical protein [Tanacetum cinerariifolium]
MLKSLGQSLISVQESVGVNFTDVLDDDTALTFLIDLGYKGPLNRHTNMFVDHMHQPCRTLAAIINKCLFRKTASNDKLKKSKIDILWGMFNRENVDYPELIWEEFAYQIDYRKENRSRRENMPYPRFIKITINHFLKQHKSLTNIKHYHTIKDDAKRKTSRKKRVKKKVTLSADDNIISDDPNTSIELAKFISQTKAEKVEAARKVHATHARIVTESVPEVAKKKSGGRSSKSVVIQHTSSTLKSKPATSKTKLKGDVSLTLQEQEAADIIQALKESKKTRRRQLVTGGLNEGTGSKLGVLDESTVDDKDGDADDEGDDHVSDKQDVDAKVEESDKGDEDIIDAINEEAKKTLEQRMDSADADVSSLLDITIQQETPKTKSPSVQKVTVSVIPETTNLPPIPEIVTETLVLTVVPSPQPIISTEKQTSTPIPTPPITTDAPTIITVVHVSDALSTVEQRVAKLEKDMSELKTIDHSTEALAILQS